MTKEDLINFTNKNNIKATEQEINTVYNHIKTYSNEILNEPIKYIKMLKEKISEENYYQILMLFDKYKNYLN